jgi:hypothetical protein
LDGRAVLLQHPRDEGGRSPPDRAGDHRDRAGCGGNRDRSRPALDAIEARLENRATIDQERYRINNRELYRMPIAELLKFRDQYRAEVQREEIAARGGNGFRAVRVVL